MSALAAPAQVQYPTEKDPYYTIGGVRLVRVTAALSIIAKPNLYAWHGKKAAERALEIHAKWLNGHIDDKTFHELFVVERLMQAGFEYRDFKGDVGSILHSVGYEWALGLRVSASDWPDYLTATVEKAKRQEPEFSADVEACRPYCDAVIAFLELTKPEFEAVGLETIGVNWTEDYAGRGDAFGCRFFAKSQDAEHPTCRRILSLIRSNGDGQSVTVTGDWKGSNYQGDEWRYQLAAYDRFENLILSSGELFDVPQSQANLNFWVRPDEAESVQVVLQPNSDREFETFLAARDLYELHHNPSARIRLSRAKPKAPPVRTTVRPTPF